MAAHLIPSIPNPDIQKERDNVSFSIQEFQEWWHGGADKLKHKRYVEEYLFKGMGDGFIHEYKSHVDIYNDAVKHTVDAATKLRKLQKELNPGGNEYMPQMMYSITSHGLMPANSPLATHLTMFVDVIKGQGTAEQIEKFAKAAENCNIIGTYAQTELAHGTNVKGIETRADYDAKSQQFVLNTPNLYAYKWWPGGLGHTCNHAMVVAQLYINGEHKGIQMFIVPVRDSETHMPLPGIDIGEIGKKVGMMAVNQGYLGLKNVRIPRENMLMKYATVKPDGTFVQSAFSKVSYLTMVYTRCLIVNLDANLLMEAATIATRYAAVRRQSPINPNDAEPQIMDHVTQQLKLFPEIAKGIVYHVTTGFMWEMYHRIVNEVNNGQFEGLQEMHILSCALKVLCTTDACAGIERLRLACGGHGYLTATNLGNIYGNAVAAYTYEGENTVLSLQIGSFLMKQWLQMTQGKKMLPSMQYLQTYSSEANLPAWNDSWEAIVKVLQYTAAQKTRVAFESFSKRMKEGQTQQEAANNTGIEFTQAAELHGRQFVVSTFLAEITGPKSSTRSASLNQVLNNILELYLVNTMLNQMHDILRFVPLKDADVRALQKRLELTFKKMRRDAVGIVDGFDFHDRVLNSVLGCYDGNVYERIFDSAKKSPMNQQPVQKSFHEHLKPFMKSNM